MPTIDVSQITYKAYVVTSAGKVIPVPDPRSLSWGESDQELAMSVTVDADNLQVDGKYLHEYVALGSHLKIYSNWGAGSQELFDGIAFVNAPTTNAAPHVQITAYDPLFYLDKSQDDLYYAAGKTGGYIIRDILQKWNVPIGTIDGPNKPLGVQAFHGSTLASNIGTVLQQSVWHGDDTYLLRWASGKASCVKVGGNSPIYVLTDAQGIQEVDDQWSMENMVTRIKITGKTDANGAVETSTTVDGQTQFGILQQIISQQSYSTLGDAKTAAQQMLDQNGQPTLTRQVIAVDLPFLRRGDAVEVHAGTLNGTYVVSGIQHDATTRTMTVSFNDVIGMATYAKNRLGVVT